MTRRNQQHVAPSHSRKIFDFFWRFCNVWFSSSTYYVCWLNPWICTFRISSECCFTTENLLHKYNNDKIVIFCSTQTITIMRIFAIIIIILLIYLSHWIVHDWLSYCKYLSTYMYNVTMFMKINSLDNFLIRAYNRVLVLRDFAAFAELSDLNLSFITYFQKVILFFEKK